MTNRPGWSRPAGIACSVGLCVCRPVGAGRRIDDGQAGGGRAFRRAPRAYSRGTATSTRARYRERCSGSPTREDRASRGARPDGHREQAADAQDGVFRLASMSSKITAVAVMMMVEEGKVRLSDPVSLHPRVQVDESRCRQAERRRRCGAGTGGPGGRGGPPPEVDLVSATREITIRDLLTCSSGDEMERR